MAPCPTSAPVRFRLPQESVAMDGRQEWNLVRPLRITAAICSAFLTLALQAAGQQSPLNFPQSSAASQQHRSVRFARQRGIGGPGIRSSREFPSRVLMRARTQHAAMVRAAAQTPVPAWQPAGPPQVSTSPFGLLTGRITSIAADPSDATGNTVYLGSTGGGVWKSTNAAGSPSTVTFTPLTDTLSVFSSAALTSLSIGSVSVQPGGNGIVLAGTGDPNEATDSWYGAGLLRSTDGGNTWALITHMPPRVHPESFPPSPGMPSRDSPGAVPIPVFLLPPSPGPNTRSSSDSRISSIFPDCITRWTPEPPGSSPLSRTAQT